MGARTRGRNAGVLVVSIAAHLAVLAVFAAQRATLAIRIYAPDVVAVTIVPFYHVQPKASPHTAPAPPLHIHQPKPREPATDVAPLHVPPAPGRSDQGALPGVGVGDHPADQPPGSRAELGRALRWGGVHCATDALPGLNQADRDRCVELVGAGAETARWLAPAMSHDKQERLQRAAKHREDCEAYKASIYAPMPNLRDGACW